MLSFLSSSLRSSIPSSLSSYLSNFLSNSLSPSLQLSDQLSVQSSDQLSRPGSARLDRVQLGPVLLGPARLLLTQGLCGTPSGPRPAPVDVGRPASTLTLYSTPTGHNTGRKGHCGGQARPTVLKRGGVPHAAVGMNFVAQKAQHTSCCGEQAER